MPARTPYHMLMRPMPLAPVGPETAALVLLDVQDFTMARGMGLDAEAVLRGIARELDEYYAQVDAARRNLGRLVAGCRAAGVAVVHLRAAQEGPQSAHFAASGLERPPSAAADATTLGAIDAAAGEPVIARGGYSAFHRTGLAEMLTGWGVSTVLLAGMMANVTLPLAAREAADRDFQVLVVQDASASETLAAHGTTMQGLAGGAIRILGTGDALAMLEGRRL